MKRLMALLLGLVLAGGAGAQDKAPPAKPDETSKAALAARDRGLDWLTKHQGKEGAWGKQFTIAVTSFACLSYLAASDEPFTGDRGQALLKGLKFLLANQKDGLFKTQGHSWIHGQGFATLALAEAYGRSLLCKNKPDLDMKKVAEVVAAATAEIAKNQSDSGGWWYTPGNRGAHEGSTTVCAVQAMVSASNFRIKTDAKALSKNDFQGFPYNVLRALQPGFAEVPSWRTSQFISASVFNVVAARTTLTGGITIRSTS